MDFQLQQILNDAQGLIDEGRYEDAYQMLEAAKVQYSDNQTLLLWLARLGVHGANRPQETIEYTKRLLELDDKNAEVFSYRGWANYELGMHEAALKDFNYAVVLSSHQDVLAVGGRGLTYYQLNDYPHAKEDLQAALSMNPEWLLGLATCGWVLYELNSYDEAIICLDRAIAMDPQYGYAYGGRGLCYYEKAEYDLAIEDLTVALKTNPSWSVGFAVRGWAYYHIEYYVDQFQAALADLTEALRLTDDNYPFAQAGLGLVYNQLNQNEQALIELNKALALNQQWVLGLATRGFVHKALEDLDAALADFNAALALTDNGYQYALGGRGLVLAEIGLYAEALNDLELLINEDAHWMAGWDMLCLAYLNTEQYSEVIKWSEAAIKKFNQDNAIFCYYRAMAAFYLDEYQTAIDYMSRYLAEYSDYGYAYYSRGFAYHKLNQLDQAIADIKRADELGVPALEGYLASLYETKPVEYGEKCLPLYEQGVADGDSFAMLRLGTIYLNGSLRLPAYDGERALALLSLANETEGGNYACALSHIGRAYELGRGTIKDGKMAYQYYQAALEREDHCICQRGYIIHAHYQGIGTSKSTEKAILALQEAVATGKEHENVDYMHAYFLAHGIGMAENRQQAAAIIKKLHLEDPESALNHYYLYALECHEIMSENEYLQAIERYLPYAADYIRNAIDQALKSGTRPYFYPFPEVV